MAIRRTSRASRPLLAALVVGGAGGCKSGQKTQNITTHAMAPAPEISLRNFLVRMARILKMNDRQKRQINLILYEEMEHTESLLCSFHNVQTQLFQVSRIVPFDEKEIRRLAQQQALIDSELTVCSLRTQNLIYGVLTPEQREMVQFLQTETAEPFSGNKATAQQA